MTDQSKRLRRLSVRRCLQGGGSSGGGCQRQFCRTGIIEPARITNAHDHNSLADLFLFPSFEVKCQERDCASNPPLTPPCEGGEPELSLRAAHRPYNRANGDGSVSRHHVAVD